MAMGKTAAMRLSMLLLLVLAILGISFSRPVGVAQAKIESCTTDTVHALRDQITDVSIPPPNQVSWQSAFWSLVPIALNSMTQPSGMVLGFPSKYGFALRSSPIVCGFEALYTVVKFVLNAFFLKNPKASALKIAKWRFRDTPGNEEGSLQKLQENTIFRMAIFLLGALPQIIKLCALQGLLWTKVWGLMFLGSFLVLELIVLLLGRDWRANNSNLNTSNYEELEDYTGVSIVCASLIFSFYFFALGMFQIVEQYLGELRWPYFLGFLLLGIVYIVNVSSSKHEALMTVAALVLAPLSMFASCNTAFLLPSLTAVSILPASVTYTILVGASVLFALSLTILTTHRLVQHVRPEFAKFIDFGLGTYFFSLNLLAALLYYAFKYHPEGTVKPSWTDQLG